MKSAQFRLFRNRPSKLDDETRDELGRFHRRTPLSSGLPGGAVLGFVAFHMAHLLFAALL
jgi:hypothetical protein